MTTALQHLCLVGCAALFLAAGASNAAAQTSDFADFVRVDVDGERTERALQVAVRRYRRAGDGPSAFVDLIGVVHVGDAAYYRELNASFRQYDALLYELVAPKEHDTAFQGERGDSLISTAQLGMKNALGLAFQLEHIDYTADNFVHADLSPQELRASMDERGESLYVYFWRAFYAGMADYARDPLGVRSWQLLGRVRQRR